MAKITKKSLLKKLQQCNEVKAIMVGGNAIEDWPEIIKNVQELHPDAEIQDRGVYLNGQGGKRLFLLKPVFNRVRTGRLFAKGGEFWFVWGDKESSGNIRDLTICEDGESLELRMMSGAKIVYQPA